MRVSVKRTVEISAILVIVLGIWFIARPVTPQPLLTKGEPRAVWNQQLKAVEDGLSTKIVMSDWQLHPTSLAELKTVSARITELNLSGDDLVRQIDAITACSHLRILHLRTVIGDEQIAALAQLRELEVLDLPLATGVTNAGLKALEGHPKLRLVRLRAPLVTDAGLAVFAQMPELRWLHLMEVPVTDAGLGVFQALPKLESLYLDGDQATDEGLSALILARPDLHFHRDQVHLSTDPRQGDGHTD